MSMPQYAWTNMLINSIGTPNAQPTRAVANGSVAITAGWGTVSSAIICKLAPSSSKGIDDMKGSSRDSSFIQACRPAFLRMLCAVHLPAGVAATVRLCHAASYQVPACEHKNTSYLQHADARSRCIPS